MNHVPCSSLIEQNLLLRRLYHFRFHRRIYKYHHQDFHFPASKSAHRQEEIFAQGTVVQGNLEVQLQKAQRWNRIGSRAGLDAVQVLEVLEVLQVLEVRNFLEVLEIRGLRVQLQVRTVQKVPVEQEMVLVGHLVGIGQKDQNKVSVILKQDHTVLKVPEEHLKVLEVHQDHHEVH